MPQRIMPPMTAGREITKPVREAEGNESVAADRRRPEAGPTPRNAGRQTDPEWAAAYRRMMARMEEGAALGGLRIKREDLYDR